MIHPIQAYRAVRAKVMAIALRAPSLSSFGSSRDASRRFAHQSTIAPRRSSTKLSPGYTKRRLREIAHAREVIERILSGSAAA